MDREQKTAVVEELAGELKEADAIFAIDYRGISVPQAAELRSSLRDADARFRVVKNRLTLRAADAAGTEPLKDHLTGPTALALVKGDAALAAKTITRLGSEWELLEYKGGLMDGDVLEADSFTAIAKLPGREALNAQLAGVVASPLTGLVRGLGSMIQGLALQLQAIADQGLVSGEAPPSEEKPPAEEEKPAEEAPAEAASEGESEEKPEGEEKGEGEETPEPEASEDQAQEPAAEGDADPEPSESPEETSEEEAPAGEEAGEMVPETGEGDADAGQAQEEASEEDASETSEDSDENKEDGS
jgi:large subunit ribosomal protein L10